MGPVLFTAGAPLPATPQLAAPTGLSITPNAGGTNNDLLFNRVTNAVTYRFQKSLDAGATFPGGAGLDWVLTDPVVTYADVGINPGIHRVYRVRAEAPGFLNSDWTVSGDIYTAAGGSGGSGAASWPTPTTFSPAIVGFPDSAPFSTLGGYTGSPKYFWVTSLSSAVVATANFQGKADHWSGTEMGALYSGFNGSSPCQIYYLTSGRGAMTGFQAINMSNCTINLNTAPSPGYHSGAKLILAPFGADIIVKGLNISRDENATGDDLNNGDGMYIGTTAGPVVFQNCSFRWTTDEIDDNTDAATAFYKAYVNCYFTEPLSRAGRTDAPDKAVHGYGPLVAYQGRNVIWARNLLAHMNGRTPHVRSSGVSILDNLMYNVGYQADDPFYFAGGVEIGANDYGSDTTVNVVGNIFMRGPNINGGAKPIQVFASTSGIPAFTSTSRVYLSENFYYDRTGVDWTYSQSNQQNHVAITAGAIPSGFYNSSIISGIHPAGYIFQSALTLTGNQPSVAAIQAKVDLITQSAGARPTDRYGRDATVAPHASNWIRNLTPVGQIINSYLDGGGHYTVPINTIPNPFDPAAFGGDPFPYADPGTLVACADGKSRRKDLMWALRRDNGVGLAKWGQTTP